MINVIGYNTNVDTVNTLIKYLIRYVHYPSKGESKAVFYKNVNGKKIVVSDEQELIKIKYIIKKQMLASLEVLGFATLNQKELYSSNKLDYLKDKCYKFLEAALDLPKGEICKSN